MSAIPHANCPARTHRSASLLAPRRCPPSPCPLADLTNWGGGWSLRAAAIQLSRPIVVLSGDACPTVFVYPATTSATSNDFVCFPSMSLVSMQPLGAYPRELFSPNSIVLHFNSVGTSPGNHFTALLPSSEQRTGEALLAAADAAMVLVANAPCA